VLDDLPLWYGAEIPDGVELDEVIATQIAARGGGVGKIMADADISRIRQKFYDLAMNNALPVESDDTYWWWVRGERYADDGGMYLIAEDPDRGDLYKFDVLVAENEVRFGQPNKVQVEYTKAAAEARAAVVAGMAYNDEGLVVHASRAETGGPEKSTQEGASKMDDAKRKRLAASCGLPEDATEAQITSRLKLIRAEADDAGAGEILNTGERVGDNPDLEGELGEPAAGTHQTPPGTAPSGTSGETPPPEDEDDEDEGEEVEASTVTVDRATWEATKRGAELANKHEAERVAARRKDKVKAAIKAGKIPPARREHYERLMAMDEDGTTTQLDSLQPGVLPVGDGVGNLGNGDEGQVTAAQGLPDEWFPDIAEKRLAASRGPATITQAREG
jgi:hypothetical protein